MKKKLFALLIAGVMAMSVNAFAAETELTEEDLTDGNIDILTMLVKSGLTASKSEARRAVQQGGVSVDGEKVTDVFQTFAGEALSGEGVVLKKGKKNFRKVLVK